MTTSPARPVLDDAPECMKYPEREPTVYWAVWGESPPGFVRYWGDVRDRPTEDVDWFGLTAEDAERDSLDSGWRISGVYPHTPKACTELAIESGMAGVGIYTYEGNEKACVRYWLVGDPIPGGGK